MSSLLDSEISLFPAIPSDQEFHLVGFFVTVTCTAVTEELLIGF